MASIHREITIEAPAATVWSALEDVGNLHTGLVPGFVTACALDGEARVVTFGNGVVARELIVDLDPQRMRVAWSAVGGRLSHHNASAQVQPVGAQACAVVWIADLLPHEMAPPIAAMIEAGLQARKRHLESDRVS